MNAFQSKFDPLVHGIIANIPKGQVMSYGDIARKAGFPRHSRMVAKSMTRCSYELPWHRVIRSNFTLAFTPKTVIYNKQKQLLLAEGCSFTQGKVIPAVTPIAEDLDKLIWGP